MRNLRGDDIYITVENKFGDIPTIVFQPTVPIGGGGGPTYKPYPQPFDFASETTTSTETDPDTGEEIEVETTNYSIVNCVWFLGREFKSLSNYDIDVDDLPATYWLKITTQQDGQFSQSEILSGAYISPAGVTSPTYPEGGSNTDNYTYFPLWSIDVDSNGKATPTFDWRPTWKTPFYST